MAVSEAESAVMEALWVESPLSAEEIIERVADQHDWRAVTVKTLLNRLLKKNAISAKRDGRRYLYEPLLNRTDYVQTQSQSLIDRLFDGRVGSLVTHFSENKKLTDEDVADLKRLIKELEDGS
ncbi:MAG: BlaI family transcriptional regulator [Hyphococcus sp.]|nr:MAG: BlaI family transcriptional regulator [Marinicaulis sp.]